MGEDETGPRRRRGHLAIPNGSGHDGRDVWLGVRMDVERIRALASGENDMPALSINVDSTSYWERPFTGEWLGMRPSVISQRDGIATVSNVLYDASGRVGTSTSSALIQGKFRTP